MDNKSFWSNLEVRIQAEIPIYIKNVLSAFGYNNAVTLRKFNEEKIKSLEDFVKNDLNLFIDTSACDLKEYYYVFSKDVSKFKIIDGHKELIMEIVNFINNKIKELGSLEIGLQYFNEILIDTPKSSPKSMRRTPKMFNLASGSSKSAIGSGTGTGNGSDTLPVSNELDTVPAIEILKVSDDLFGKIKSYFGKNKLAIDSKFPQFTKDMIQVKVEESNETEIDYCANITCPSCKVVIKAFYKSYDRSVKGRVSKTSADIIPKRWYFNSFTRHVLSSHALIEENNTETPSKTAKRKHIDNDNQPKIDTKFEKKTTKAASSNSPEKFCISDDDDQPTEESDLQVEVQGASDDIEPITKRKRTKTFPIDSSPDSLQGGV